MSQTQQAPAPATALPKQYVNGLFPVRKNGPYGEFFNIGVKKEVILKEIEAMDADPRGFINLTMSPQKTNPDKYSVYVDNFVPKPRVNPAPTDRPAATPTTTGSQPDDSLPF